MPVISKKSVIGLKGLPQILPEQWKKIGIGLIGRIRKDCQKGYSQDGNKPHFEEYSEKYAQKKRGGYAIKKRAISTQTNPPNLKLTGKMLKTMWVKRPTRSGFILQYKEGQKVLYNRDKDGRDIFDLNIANWKFLTDEVMKVFHKNAKMLKSIKIKIGK